MYNSSRIQSRLLTVILKSHPVYHLSVLVTHVTSTSVVTKFVQPQRFDFLLTTILTSEGPIETNHIGKIVRSFNRKSSSLLQLSQAPTSSTIKMDSSFHNPTRWVTKFFSPTFHWNSAVLFSVSPLNMVLDHAPTAAFATEAYPEFEQNLSVSCYRRFPLAFANNCQIQDSGSGLLASAPNTLITGVSLLRAV